ncbi:MAG: 50S ribosomal protein L22 [Desulfarculus sp.]|jgi:large subunit ribosomal protein L22|nr:MAG: 50S ribosomal protein L22 [Desulfarculus sp.]
MEAVAKAKYIRISPRKARLVADAVRGLKVGEALNQLRFTPKKAARLLTKVINSAVANASQRPEVDVDKLYIKEAFVDGGPMLKRWRARAMGRAYVIRKRTAHITVVVDER